MRGRGGARIACLMRFARRATTVTVTGTVTVTVTGTVTTALLRLAILIVRHAAVQLRSARQVTFSDRLRALRDSKQSAAQRQRGHAAFLQLAAAVQLPGALLFASHCS